MEFKEWMDRFMRTPEWESDSFHWDNMAESAFKSGMDNAIIRTSTFTLSPFTATSVWLQKVGEEGMEISLESMEEELQRIFEARF